MAVHLAGRALHVRPIVVVQGQHERLQRVTNGGQVHHQLHGPCDLVAERQEAAESNLECADNGADEGAVLEGGNKNKLKYTHLTKLSYLRQ